MNFAAAATASRNSNDSSTCWAGCQRPAEFNFHTGGRAAGIGDGVFGNADGMAETVEEPRGVRKAIRKSGPRRTRTSTQVASIIRPASICHSSAFVRAKIRFRAAQANG